MTCPPGFGTALAFVGLWIALAAVQPTTTWHLAPVLIVAWPVLASFQRPVSRSPLPVIVGAGLALSATGLLGVLDLLRGGVLVGTDALAESLLFTAGAAGAGLVAVGARAAVSR